jgi:oligopeptide/dipeptide ABC transporter ATP-binding protein
MSSLLELRGVTKIFGSGEGATRAVSDFSHRIDDAHPTITAIAGESGSGKSTVARLILGFEHPSYGRVLYRGKDLHAIGRDERRTFRQDVQAIFQDPFGVYNPFYRIDHLLYTPVKSFKLARNKADATDKIRQALRTVGLNPDEVLGRYPHQLSGGQRQRITIARALLLQPKLILADEPVSMIDASLRASILDSLQTLNREYRISFVYITHDLTTAYQIAETLIVLFQGTQVESGPVADVVRSPKHPYSQLLVNSIPSPDPEKPWGADAVGTRDPAEVRLARGCPFAARCPYVMDECIQAHPPRYQVGRAAVACYLYKDQPLAADDAVPDAIGSERDLVARR